MKRRLAADAFDRVAATHPRTHAHTHACRHVREGGYVLLGVLLISVLLTSMVLGFSRHVVQTADSAQATRAALAALDAADSGLAWARQTLLADGSASAALDMGDGRRVNVSLADAGTDLHSIHVETAGDGVTQEFDATAETYARAGSRLPELTSDARAAVAASAQLISISGTVAYSDTQITGVLSLQDGAVLTLTNVVLDGAIVSDCALFAGTTTGTVHLRQGVQITPGTLLPGVAILAPGVAFDGDGTERVQFEGVVVADSLSLPGMGAVHGQISSASTASLSAAYDLVGGGRGPRAWPTVVDTRAAGVGRVSFPVQDTSETEQSAIRTFSFPSGSSGAVRMTGVH